MALILQWGWGLLAAPTVRRPIISTIRVSVLNLHCCFYLCGPSLQLTIRAHDFARSDLQPCAFFAHNPVPTFVHPRQFDALLRIGSCLFKTWLSEGARISLIVPASYFPRCSFRLPSKPSPWRTKRTQTRSRSSRFSSILDASSWMSSLWPSYARNTTLSISTRIAAYR